mgnify:FL=1
MRANRKNLEIALARECMSREDLRCISGLPRSTINSVFMERDVRPSTLGKIARALNCDPADLIEEVKE